MFDPQCATVIGLNKAVIMHNIMFWILTNSSNKRHLHDGRYWMYNSAEAFREFHPYWSGQQIKRLLRQLEDDGWILSNNYNTSSYDRTKWYAVTDKCISQNWTVHCLKITNGKFASVPPIPENTQIQPENPHTPKGVVSESSAEDTEKEGGSHSASSKDHEDSFKILWNKYNKKQGEVQAAVLWNRLTNKDRAEVLRNVDAYVKSTPDKKFRKALTTYLNKKNRLWTDEIEKDLSDRPKPVRVCTERIAGSTRGKIYFIDKTNQGIPMNSTVTLEEFQNSINSGLWVNLGKYSEYKKSIRGEET